MVRVLCNNDMAGTACVVFNHMANAEVATGSVPPEERPTCS